MSKKNKKGLSVNSDRYKQFQLAAQQAKLDGLSFWLGAAAARGIPRETALNEHGNCMLDLNQGKGKFPDYVEHAINRQLDPSFGTSRSSKQLRREERLQRRLARKQEREMLRQTHRQGRAPQPEPSYG